MSRIRRAVVAASLSAVAFSTLALPATTFADAEYVVKPGDSLAGIARKVGVALPELLSVNSLTTKSLILPGDKLVVPAAATSIAPAAAAPAAAPAVVHTVKAGDYLMGIATLYKVTLPELLAVNKMTVKSVITPGMPLALPANAVSPQAAQPAAAAAATPAPAGLAYTVKSGDYLAGIASIHKVKLRDLLATNKLKATSLILPGATLTLPAGAVESATTAALVESTASPASVVVAYASAQLGKPYRFFTAGPNTFDCSGLVRAAFARIGIDLPHHSASQAGFGTAVNFWSEPLKAGDLIFMATHDGSPEISHVGIAVDATQWIQATSPGDVVRQASIPAKGVITAVRRLIP